MKGLRSTGLPRLVLKNKTKVIRADLLDFTFDLDFYFEDSFRFGNISVLVTFLFR